MLTWAIVLLTIKSKVNMPILFIVSMGCDVGIVYYIASGFAGHLL